MNNLGGTPSDFSGKHFLIVDDVYFNRFLLKTLIKGTGCTYDLAEDGRMALDKVRETYKNGKKYNIILMDIQMPNMDGKEATEILRQEGYTMPIIVQSAYINEYSKEELLDMGFSNYLNKPIKRELLFRTIDEQLDTVFSANLVNKESSTKKMGIQEKTYAILKEYEESDIELKPSAIKKLPLNEISRFYSFLQKKPERTIHHMKRPEKVNYGHTGGVPLYSHKKKLNDYIAQWGFSFKGNPANLGPCLLEASINFCEQNNSL